MIGNALKLLLYLFLAILLLCVVCGLSAAGILPIEPKVALAALGLAVGAFLAVIVVLGIGLYLLKRKLVGALGEFAGTLEGMRLPPPEISLEPAGNAVWRDAKRVDQSERQLKSLGFSAVGTFKAREIKSLLLRGFCKPSEGVWAVIYEQPPIGVWVDVVAEYADGSSATYSNARDSGLDAPPGKTRVYAPELDAVGLYERWKDERGNRETVAVRPEDFPQVFEAAYAKEMAWRNSREGATYDEVRRVAERTGEYDSETLDLTKHVVSLQSRAGLEIALRRTFKAQKVLSPAEHEQYQNRLFFVHDRMDRDNAIRVLRGWPATPPTPEQRAADPLRGEDIRRAFADENLLLPTEKRFRKIAELDEPVPADVYLAPHDLHD